MEYGYVDGWPSRIRQTTITQFSLEYMYLSQQIHMQLANKSPCVLIVSNMHNNNTCLINLLLIYFHALNFRGFS